jgi:hypothetical protein
LAKGARNAPVWELRGSFHNIGHAHSTSSTNGNGVIGADSPGIPIRNTEEKTFLSGSKSRIFFYNNALRLYGLKR